MASLRVLIRSTSSLNTNLIGLSKGYAQFPPNYIKPVYNKDEQKLLKESGTMKEMQHASILPVSGSETSSEFFDALTHKFIKYLMRDGKKEMARKLITDTYEEIKSIQVKRYHQASPEEREEIELDPKKILVRAVENACPVMILHPMKRGGITYQVPIPITPKRSQFLGMKWLLESGFEKDRTISFAQKMAFELIDAADNKGRVVTRKKDLYKKCEANRAYAHYRWL